MRHKLHASWLIAAGSVGTVFGAVLALWARDFGVALKLFLVVAGVLFIAGILSKSRYAVVFLFTAGLFFGGGVVQLYCILIAYMTNGKGLWLR